MELFLVESKTKKCRFLEEAVQHLNLTNVSVLNERAETLSGDPSLFHAFDIVTARSVGKLPELLSWSRPLLRSGESKRGVCLFPKGSRYKEELRMIDKSRWNISVIDLFSYLVEKTDREFVVIKAFSI